MRFLYYLFLLPPPRLIITNLIYKKDAIPSIQQLQKKFQVSDKNTILFQEMGLQQPFDSYTSLTMMDLLSDDNQVIPTFHTYTKFHHDYIYGRYLDKIPYNVYCLLEEKLANVAVNLLEKEETQMIIFQNTEWFFDESFQSFLTTEETSKIHTCLLVDLDIKPKLEILPRCNEKRFFWGNNLHGFI
jgi:hypothetical protein